MRSRQMVLLVAASLLSWGALPARPSAASPPPEPGPSAHPASGAPASGAAGNPARLALGPSRPCAKADLSGTFKLSEETAAPALEGNQTVAPYDYVSFGPGGAFGELAINVDPSTPERVREGIAGMAGIQPDRWELQADGHILLTKNGETRAYYRCGVARAQVLGGEADVLVLAGAIAGDPHRIVKRYRPWPGPELDTEPLPVPPSPAAASGELDMCERADGAPGETCTLLRFSNGTGQVKEGRRIEQHLALYTIERLDAHGIVLRRDESTENVLSSQKRPGPTTRYTGTIKGHRVSGTFTSAPADASQAPKAGTWAGAFAGTKSAATVFVSWDGNPPPPAIPATELELGKKALEVPADPPVAIAASWDQFGGDVGLTNRSPKAVMAVSLSYKNSVGTWKQIFDRCLLHDAPVPPGKSFKTPRGSSIHAQYSVTDRDQVTLAGVLFVDGSTWGTQDQAAWLKSSHAGCEWPGY